MANGSETPDSTPPTEDGSKEGGHGSGLTLFILIAIVVGIVFALVAPNLAMKFEIGGEIFLNVLKMMVVPLVVSSVMAGILGLGDIRKLGKPGLCAVGYYFSTTILAVTLGLVVVNIIQPGKGTVSEEQQAAATAKQQAKTAAQEQLRKKLADDSGLSEEQVGAAIAELKVEEDKTVWVIIENLVLMLFTDNLLESAVEGDLLPLIVFSLVFAGMLTTMGGRVDNITQLVEQINHAFLAFVLLLMKIAPLGIFCLVTARFGEAQSKGEFIQEIQQISWYMATVLTGLGIHAFITIPLILWFFTKRNPYLFMLQISQALLTAFSTASSSATLPVTMETSVENAGVSRKSVEFVLPLGATINMDGTALYEAAAAIFIAQVYGTDLSLAQQLIVAMTATLAAIGAAGIPEAGLVTMLIVLNAVGLPLELIGLILSVDWLLDRFRTTVNVFGDAAGAAIIEQTFPPDEPAPVPPSTSTPPPEGQAA